MGMALMVMGLGLVREREEGCERGEGEGLDSGEGLGSGDGEVDAGVEMSESQGLGTRGDSESDSPNMRGSCRGVVRCGACDELDL